MTMMTNRSSRTVCFKTDVGKTDNTKKPTRLLTLSELGH